ncbi:MAG: hypothetical protein K6U74_16795, partial [Firmicutes bacterium]|nr:hypothetical protein [Bacillota bacterium]
MKMPHKRPWSERLERAFIRLAAAVAALVMIAQVFMSGDSLNQAAAPVNAPERTQSTLKNPAGLLQGHVVTLQLKNYSSLPLARVLVNGEPRGEFKDRYVTVFVFFACTGGV